jgi:eukaryotic-like serine/threonine-protein kinase
VYDEEPYQYTPPPRSPIPAAILTSIVTTIALFFGLRLLEDRGVFPRAPRSEGVQVPSVLGLKPEQAREVLKTHDLVLSPSGELDDPRVPPGAIAAQAPLPGAPSPRGAAVQVTVSKPPAAGALQVPNLIGVRAEDAARQLAAAGLELGPQKTTASTTVPPGAVVQTEPSAGAAVPPHSVVSLVLSSGSVTSAVPKITGMRLTRARKTLELAGFQVGKIRYGSNEDRMGGVILKQDPAEGTPAAPGTAIDVVVNEE